MTYAGFLLLFLLIPLGILVGFLRERLLDRRYLTIAGILTLVALIYMAPWDHFAAIWGLWSWRNSHSWGIRWWAIPPEEYLFCALEALLAITLTFAILTRNERHNNLSVSKSSSNKNSNNTYLAPPPENTCHDKTITPTSPSSTHNERADRENAS
jgi:lycopene cyclase domain-containing protein